MSTCEKCNGSGLIENHLPAGGFSSCPCECQGQKRCEVLEVWASFPSAYRDASIENFKTAKHVQRAIMTAGRYIEEYASYGRRQNAPGSGLLLSGSVGTGKTHLAIAIGREVIRRYQARVRFVDARELLQRLRQSYDAGSQEREVQILGPIIASDLVILDELGAVKPTDWSFETTELLIGRLYNSCTQIIVTTNFPNAGPGAANSSGYERAARAETLGDRIGGRMWSRLQQMCVCLDMTGPDYRVQREATRG